MACVLCSRNHHRARHDMYHHHLHRNWQPANNSIMLIRIAAMFGSNLRAWCSPCDHHELDRFLPAESMAHALAPGVGRIDRWAGRKRRWRLRQEGLGGQHAGKTWDTSFLARTCAARATCEREEEVFARATCGSATCAGGLRAGGLRNPPSTSSGSKCDPSEYTGADQRLDLRWPTRRRGRPRLCLRTDQT